MNERLMKATVDLAHRIGKRADEQKQTTTRDARELAAKIARTSSLSPSERDDLIAASDRFADPSPSIPRWIYTASAIAAAVALVVWLWSRDRTYKFDGVIDGGPTPSALREVPRIPCEAPAPVLAKRIEECSGPVTILGADPALVELRSRSATYRFARSPVTPEGTCSWRVEVTVEQADVDTTRTCLGVLGAR